MISGAGASDETTKGKHDMPNQRKKGKKLIAVWLSEQEQQLIDKLVADGAISSKSDLFKEAIIKRAKEKGYLNDPHRI